MPTSPPAIRADEPAAALRFDSAAEPVFLVNAASGSQHGQEKRALIEAAIAASGRKAELWFADPNEVDALAPQAAAVAAARHTAVVAVGGDGTINTVSRAAHAQGCALGVVAQGTFNYFARTHGLPLEPEAAVQAALAAQPQPVQVATVNDRLFLVNASLGLYPELLQDREAYKARWGRSRGVALMATALSLLREHRQLRLFVESGGVTRDVRTPTLFVGNNRLQLEQLGLREAPALDRGRIAAVMLKPIGTLSLFGLLLRGAFGTLGEADTVDTFDFQRLVVRPRLAYGRRRVKVSFDGEVGWMRWPLIFKVADRPLHLLKAPVA